MLGTLSLIALVLVAALCAVGALSHAFDDNLLQRVGMAGVGLAAVALADHVWRVGSITPACGLMSIGMLAYAAGTASKVVQYRRCSTWQRGSK